MYISQCQSQTPLNYQWTSKKCTDRRTDRQCFLSTIQIQWIIHNICSIMETMNVRKWSLIVIQKVNNWQTGSSLIHWYFTVFYTASQNNLVLNVLYWEYIYVCDFMHSTYLLMHASTYLVNVFSYKQTGRHIYVP